MENTLTNAERNKINEKLDRAITGWEDEVGGDDPRDFTRSAEANMELMAWLASDDARWKAFDKFLCDSIYYQDSVAKSRVDAILYGSNDGHDLSIEWRRLIMTAPLETIAKAALAVIAGATKEK